MRLFSHYSCRADLLQERHQVAPGPNGFTRRHFTGTSADPISVRAAGSAVPTLPGLCVQKIPSPQRPRFPPYEVKLYSSFRAHLQMRLHYKAILGVPNSKLPSFYLFHPYPAFPSLSPSYYLTKSEIIYLSGSLLNVGSGITGHILLVSPVPSTSTRPGCNL